MHGRLPTQHPFTRLGAWLAGLWARLRGGRQASADPAAPAVRRLSAAPTISTFWYNAPPLPVTETVYVFDGESRLVQVIHRGAAAGKVPPEAVPPRSPTRLLTPWYADAADQRGRRPGEHGLQRGGHAVAGG
jgi:hypothetical protein